MAKSLPKQLGSTVILKSEPQNYAYDWAVHFLKPGEGFCLKERWKAMLNSLQHNVTSITNTPVGAVESSGSEILPSAPLFSIIGVPLGSRLSACLKNKIRAEKFVNFGSLLDTSPNLDKFALSITPPTARNGSKTPYFTLEPVNNAKKLTSIHKWISSCRSILRKIPQRDATFDAIL